MKIKYKKLTMYRHKSISHHRMRISHGVVTNNFFKAISKHSSIVLFLQINVGHFAVSLEVIWLSGFDLVQDINSFVNVAFL